MLPVVLIVPPITSSPIFVETGIGSPVTIDWSTAEEPSVTTPSTGIRSPGLMITTSPPAALAESAAIAPA